MLPCLNTVFNGQDHGFQSKDVNSKVMLYDVILIYYFHRYNDIFNSKNSPNHITMCIETKWKTVANISDPIKSHVISCLGSRMFTLYSTIGNQGVAS